VNKFAIYAAALAALFFLFKKRKGSDEPGDEPDDVMQELKNAFSQVIETYGADKAKKLEQLYRWETAHFKSKQFKNCYTPGMEIGGGKTVFPFGWSSLKQYADANNLQADEFTTISMPEGGTGRLKTFVCFPDVVNAVMFTAYVLNKRSWNPGAWFSTDAAAQQRYNEKIKGVIPRIVNELTK